MQAIEFQTQLKHGQLTIPPVHYLNDKQTVRVLILIADWMKSNNKQDSI